MTIATPLQIIFSKSLMTGQVPGDWKKSNVTPIFKSGDKTDPNNYRPVSLTCHICKVFESIIKDAMVTFLNEGDTLNKNQHGFTKNKSCLTNLLTFIEYVSEEVDLGHPVDVLYLDFKKAFDTVPLDLLVYKLKAYGVDDRVLRWIENWLKGRLQRVVLNGSMSTWEDVKSGVPQGSVLGPVLFLLYINDLGGDIVNKIIKFADDTKSYGAVSTRADIETMRGDLAKLVEWSGKWGMDFNIKKCKVMHIGNKNLQEEYYINGQKLERVVSERDLGVIINENLKSSDQCCKAVKTANRVFGMIKRTFVSRDRQIIVPLYKALVRPHLEYCVQAWRPHYKKDIDLIEGVQHRVTRCVNGMQGLNYDERLASLGLPSLEFRRMRGDLIEVFKMAKGFSELKFEDFFVRARANLRGHQFKVFKTRFNRDIGKFSFCNRNIDMWNRLPIDIIDSTSVNTFKNRLDIYLREERGYL